jgi:hypothetical protein
MYAIAHEQPLTRFYGRVKSFFINRTEHAIEALALEEEKEEI